MKEFQKGRVRRLLAEIEKRGLDALVTLNLRNVRWLTGYSGSNGACVVSPKGCFFFTDFRYAAQVKTEVTSMRAVISQKPLPAAAAATLKELGAKRIGFEHNDLRVSQMATLRKGAAGKWVPCDAIEKLRMVKDAAELKLLEKNFGYLAEVFKDVGDVLVPGRRESEAAAMLEYRLRLQGGEKAAFDFIVASGPRSAMPHGVASKKKMKKGEIVILDWGWVLDGYHSDNTRTLFLGKPKPKLKEIFEIVLEANERAIAKVAPGVPLKEIDAAARDFIEQRGYGKEFGHGTGHGVGLDIHEAPGVSWRSAEEAREGMVFTIEPGIYLPGIGGVRIEDVVHVTAKGCRVLTKNIPKGLHTL